MTGAEAITLAHPVRADLPTEVIELLSSTPQRFEAMYRLMPEGTLRWTPDDWTGIPGEKFSAAEQACHLRDIEIDGYHVRIRRMRDETEPGLVSFDSYELARARDYTRLDPEEALAAFRAARMETLALLKQVTPAHLERTGTFGEYGRVTLRGVIHLLCSHDLQHLSCMQWLLAKAVQRGR